MSERKPHLSIGMPVYNGERFVSDALDCLLAQTFSDFELIISDNGSTDRTEEICRDYAARDPRIRYERHEQNRGAIWNFNHVFSLAQGSYFKWASYDDTCEPTFLERCVDVLDGRPDVVWCHTQSAKIDEQGERLTKDPDAHAGFAGWVHTSQAGLPRQHFGSNHPHQRFRGVLLGTDWCADSYGVIRADALRKTCLLPTCYGAEKVLMADLSLQGLYHEVPETLFYQRVHAEASGNLRSAAAQQSFMNPAHSTRFAGTRLKLLSGYARAIRNAQLSRLDRWRCYAALVSYVCQVRKWRRVLRSTLTGTGIKCQQTTDSLSPTDIDPTNAHKQAAT
jgi:glycosyltransferase involved in cell wall biosynthesis